MQSTTECVSKEQAKACVAKSTLSLLSPEQVTEEMTATTTATTGTHSVPAAYKVFQIPELADSIARFLRPIYMSQLRLVCKTFYTAFIPYLRFHLHRNSTASWTAFPLLQHDSQDNSPVGSRRTSKKLWPVEMAGAKDGFGTFSLSEPTESTNALLGTQSTPLWKGLGIGRSYGDLVHTITADSMDNFDTLTPILLQCPNLHTLSVTRWNKDLHVFRGVFPMLSKLQTLNVSFYNTVDLNIFLGYLASSSSPSSLLGKTSKEILAENALRTCFSMTAATGEERSRSQGLVSLRSLDIKNRVPDTNFIRWKVFKNTLDRLPSLLRLGLTGIGFLGGKDNTETIGVADPDATTPLPASATANESTNLGIGTHYQGIHEDEDDYDDDDDDDDGEDGEQTRSFESGNGEPRRTYPHLQSLALSFCYCPVTIMLDLDLIFPNLTALEVNKCRNTWLHVFEPDPLNPTSHLGMSLSLASLMSSFTSTADSAATTTLPENANTITGAISAISTATTATTTTASNANAVPTGTQRVPFLGLTHLKLVEQYEGNEDLIYEIVKARPGLVSLETHQISLNVDTLLPMATACSNHRRFFDRFSLSYCWSNSQTRRDYERLFEAPFLSRAKHLYIQQEITKKMQFTSTLISLHIGAGFSKQSAIENDSLHVWNEILRSLPKLEVLRIDRYIKDFLLFEGLGRSSSDSNNNSDSKSTGDLIAETTSTAATVREGTGGGGAIDNWTQERPYLRELHITFRPSCVVQTADLDRELVQRFRFLERLSISCTKRPDDLADYTGRWRPGLTVEHCRNEMRKHGYIE